MFKWLTKNDTPPPPLLDEDFLARLADHLGTDAVNELMADAMIELADKLSDLDDSASCGDISAIGRICHDIAGIAGHMGLTRMSHHAVAASRIANKDTSVSGVALIAPVLECRRQSLDALAAFCAARTDQSDGPGDGTKSQQA